MDLESLAETIGEKVRTKRKKTGESMEAVSEKAGISKGALYRIETGKQLPSLRVLAHISNYLKVKIRNFLP